MAIKVNTDVIFFFLVNTGNSTFGLWGPLLPYIASYGYNYNENITMSFVFATAFFTMFGISLPNYVLPYLYQLIGIRMTLVLGGLLYLFNCVFFIYRTTTIWICFSSLLIGICYQIFTMTTHIFFNDKYTTEAKSFASYSITGVMIGNFFMTLGINWYINPNNEPMIDFTNSDGKVVRIFDLEISNRVNGYLQMIGFYTFFVVIFAAIFIQPTEKYRGRLFSYFFSGNQEDMVLIDEKQTKEINNSFTESVLSKSVKQRKESKEEELVANTDTGDEKKIKEKDELWTKEFWLNYIVSTQKIGIMVYYLDNYKVIGMSKIHDDVFINRVWSIATIAGVLGTMSAPLIWKRFKFISSYHFSVIKKIIMLITLYLWGSQKYVFGLFGLLTRYGICLDRMFNYYSLFELYDDQTVLRLSKVYETQLAVGFIISAFLNSYIVWNDDYDYILFFFLACSFVSLFLIEQLKKLINRKTLLCE